jgi:hypothetical protein
MSPQKRTETPSATTMLLWLRKYLVWTAEMEDAKKITPGYAARVAKGLKYSIKALDESIVEYKTQKRATAREEYEQAASRYKDV